MHLTDVPCTYVSAFEGVNPPRARGGGGTRWVGSEEGGYRGAGGGGGVARAKFGVAKFGAEKTFTDA